MSGLGRAGRLQEAEMLSPAGVPGLVVEEIWGAPDPETLARALRHRPGFFYLDTARPEEITGRAFSFLGFNPFLIWRAKHDRIVVESKAGREERVGDPWEHLRALMNRYACASAAEIPFPGGAVGYFGYEFGARSAGVPSAATEDPDLPGAQFSFYDGLLAFDQSSGKTYAVANPVAARSAKEILTELREAVPSLSGERCLGGARPPGALAYPGASSEPTAVEPSAPGGRAPPTTALVGGQRNPSDLGEAHRLQPQTQSPPDDVTLNVQTPGDNLRSNLTRAAYLDRVQRAQAYIAAGDIYQVNLAQRFELATPEPPFAIYERLRRLNPAAFAAYLDLGSTQILSSSPELLARIDARRTVVTRPIKGTRPRGSSPLEDRKLSDELTSSDKDQAELLMIVDLLRNDLGRVCQFGSVRVNERARLESHPTVFHLVATISGELRNDRDVFDCLQSLLPGGSITGAPKIRAMQIIAELEPDLRNVYTGSIGYLGFDGTCDFNIAIRTILCRAGQASYHVGGAIVADSDPESEYQETLTKGRALRAALLGQTQL